MVPNPKQGGEGVIEDLSEETNIVQLNAQVNDGCKCWKVVCRGVKGYGGVGTDEGQDA